MYPLCILEPLQIHVSHMYPACIPHVSIMYPTCVPPRGCAYLATATGARKGAKEMKRARTAAVQLDQLIDLKNLASSGRGA